MALVGHRRLSLHAREWTYRGFSSEVLTQTYFVGRTFDVLALDGGGYRCLSEIILLDHFLSAIATNSLLGHVTISILHAGHRAVVSSPSCLDV